MSVDDLIREFLNINLEDKDMATNQETVNIALLRYQADNIPDYYGSPTQLNRFIQACENLIRSFQNVQRPNDPINTCILDTVFSKLKNRAADLIGSRSELNNWNSIKEALILTFSDQRSIDCLIQDLISIRRKKNESSLEFGMRIQDSRSLLFSKLNSTILNEIEKQIKINHYNDFALKTFINGLSYNMQLPIRLKNPNSLEQALSFVTEEENFIYFNQGYNNNLNVQYKPQPRVNHVFQNNHHSKKPNYQYPKNSYNNHYNTQSRFQNPFNNNFNRNNSFNNFNQYPNNTFNNLYNNYQRQNPSSHVRQSNFSSFNRPSFNNFNRSNNFNTSNPFNYNPFNHSHNKFVPINSNRTKEIPMEIDESEHSKIKKNFNFHQDVKLNEKPFVRDYNNRQFNKKNVRNNFPTDKTLAKEARENNYSAIDIYSETMKPYDDQPCTSGNYQENFHIKPHSNHMT